MVSCFEPHGNPASGTHQGARGICIVKIVRTCVRKQVHTTGSGRVGLSSTATWGHEGHKHIDRHPPIGHLGFVVTQVSMPARIIQRNHVALPRWLRWLRSLGKSGKQLESNGQDNCKPYLPLTPSVKEELGHDKSLHMQQQITQLSNAR